jgi:methylase of polypeptide subunit release factors
MVPSSRGSHEGAVAAPRHRDGAGGCLAFPSNRLVSLKRKVMPVRTLVNHRHAAKRAVATCLGIAATLGSVRGSASWQQASYSRGRNIVGLEAGRHQQMQASDIAADDQRSQWVRSSSSAATSDTSVHHDPENLQLFRAAAARLAECMEKCAASGHRVSPELRILDLGSGSGVWGLTVAAHLRRTEGLEQHSIRLVFADICEASIDLSLANAGRSCGALAPARADAFGYDGFVGDMFEAVSCKAMQDGQTVVGRERLKDQRPFDVILFNPPQTGGHDAFRASRHALEKYGGEDGSLFYRRFAREVGSLAHDETACVLAQIGLANPVRVERSLCSAGFGSVTELARQQRTTTVSEHIISWTLSTDMGVAVPTWIGC